MTGTSELGLTIARAQTDEGTYVRVHCPNKDLYFRREILIATLWRDYVLSTGLWQYKLPGNNAWRDVTLPQDVAHFTPEAFTTMSRQLTDVIHVYNPYKSSPIGSSVYFYTIIVDGSCACCDDDIDGENFRDRSLSMTHSSLAARNTSRP